MYLDGLRGLAALIIAIGHFSDIGWTKLGNEMSMWVGFFFLLSGFILTKAYKKAVHDNRLTFKDYISLRLSRLYPLHLLTWAVCATLLLVFYLLKLYIQLNTTGLVQGDAVYPCNVYQAIEALTFTHFLWDQGVCFNTPSWSISVEFWCSLFAFFLFIPNRRMWKLLFVVAIFVAFGLIQLHGGFLNSTSKWVYFIEKNYAICLACFTGGWIVATFTQEHLNRYRMFAGFTCIIFAILMTTLGMVTFSPWVEVLFYIFCILILWSYNTIEAPRHAFVRGVLTRSGLYSYGIYLWHMPVLMCFERMTAFLDAYHYPIRGSLWMDLLYLSTVIVVSHFSYHLFEVPSKRWLRQKLLRHKKETQFS